MATAKEIRDRIVSIRKTHENHQSDVSDLLGQNEPAPRPNWTQTRPYFSALQAEIKRIFRTVEDADSPYIYPDVLPTHPDGVFGCLVITADKGLAGSYNLNVIREAEAAARPSIRPRVCSWSATTAGAISRSTAFPSKAAFSIRPKTRRCRRRGRSATCFYPNSTPVRSPKSSSFTPTSSNGLEIETRNVRLIPFHKDYFRTHENERTVTAPFEFRPSVSEVLESIMKSYISGYIYSALVDSFCSEQQARMTAMDGANRNAEKLLGELSAQYNRVRQSAITMSITEVSAGAKAQKQNSGGRKEEQ